ncbi:MAG: hypothetical protein KF782_08320 [Labilithrix sp.]|nr:hypothetical protein [Labilithrix sp.]
MRRRVYDAEMLEKEVEAPRAFTMATQPPSLAAPDDDEEDDSGPPSSINVARALASLRADELQRVEELVRADDEDVRAGRAAPLPAAAPAPVPAAAPAVPTLAIGKTIALSDLAERMGVPAEDLPATLVARGFYALHAKTVLPRETARVIAEMYGWRVEDAAGDAEDSAPVKSGTRSRIATKRKVGTKGKAKAAKPAKRGVAR